MVTRHGGGSSFGFGFGSGSCIGSSDVELREFIVTEISQAILEETHNMLGTINKGMIDLMDECMHSLRVELATS